MCSAPVGKDASEDHSAAICIVQCECFHQPLQSASLCDRCSCEVSAACIACLPAPRNYLIEVTGEQRRTTWFLWTVISWLASLAATQATSLHGTGESAYDAAIVPCHSQLSALCSLLVRTDLHASEQYIARLISVPNSSGLKITFYLNQASYCTPKVKPLFILVFT